MDGSAVGAKIARLPGHLFLHPRDDSVGKIKAFGIFRILRENSYSVYFSFVIYRKGRRICFSDIVLTAGATDLRFKWNTIRLYRLVEKDIWDSIFLPGDVNTLKSLHEIMELGS
ncbi:hypothetical protein [Thermosulfurimonas sp. F29]|uniref:hypothetical protein n=1 Tax=Thermosulfurimonas sp. F29 TaxID=2867247 RepID=UPI001C8401D3|nr:hypothetical protein [Thermosulfurimonas sp. F29]MBX6422927.1 hypothetical protein [Thermosulfurimonas sp. F29]